MQNDEIRNKLLIYSDRIMELLANRIPYKDRLIENTKINDAVIDTIEIIECRNIYETAIKHPNYNDNDWITVEFYKNKNKAIEGHFKWVKRISKKLPDMLIDIIINEKYKRNV